MPLITLKMKAASFSLLFKPKSVELGYHVHIYLKFRIEDKLFQGLVDKIQYSHLPRLVFEIALTTRRKSVPNSVSYYICTLCSRNIIFSEQVARSGKERLMCSNLIHFCFFVSTLGLLSSMSYFVNFTKLYFQCTLLWSSDQLYQIF